jgi:hypothetical protein
VPQHAASNAFSDCGAGGVGLWSQAAQIAALRPIVREGFGRRALPPHALGLACPFTEGGLLPLDAGHPSVVSLHLWSS